MTLLHIIQEMYFKFCIGSSGSSKLFGSTVQQTETKPIEEYTSRMQSLTKSYSALDFYRYTVLYNSVTALNDYFTQNTFHILIFLGFAPLVLIKMQIDQSKACSIMSG